MNCDDGRLPECQNARMPVCQYASMNLHIYLAKFHNVNIKRLRMNLPFPFCCDVRYLTPSNCLTLHLPIIRYCTLPIVPTPWPLTSHHCYRVSSVSHLWLRSYHQSGRNELIGISVPRLYLCTLYSTVWSVS